MRSVTALVAGAALLTAAPLVAQDWTDTPAPLVAQDWTDTNVLSELMKPAPTGRVVDWMAAQPAASLYATSITQAEILHGLMLLPRGQRRSALEAAATSMFALDFVGRILGFGTDAAPAYAQIASDRRRAGHPISHFEAQIAAIAVLRVLRSPRATWLTSIPAA